MRNMRLLSFKAFISKCWEFANIIIVCVAMDIPIYNAPNLYMVLLETKGVF